MQRLDCFRWVMALCPISLKVPPTFQHFQLSTHNALGAQIVWVGRAVVAATAAAIMYLSWAYGAMMRRNSLNVDDYTGSQPGFMDRVSVALTHW